MKARSHCRDCLKGLARQEAALAGGDDGLIASSLDLIDALFNTGSTPTYVSNRLHEYIREQTGVEDPYGDRKEIEFREVLAASRRLTDFFPDTLEGALCSSAFGNGGDFFLQHRYDADGLTFHGNVAKIGHAVYISSKILILGDNLSDFVFDQPLVGFLKSMGKQVFYAVKERPVQNDMSMADVERFGADAMCDCIISTGTNEVGIRREEMSGIVRQCWEDGSCVIAKGMGNYETISEFDQERPVVYVMNVKCESVAEATGRKVGEYIAITGGKHG